MEIKQEICEMKTSTLLMTLLTWSIIFNTDLRSQSQRALLGYGGLLVVPSAATLADGQICLGIGHIPKLYAEFKPDQRFVVFAAVGFLPRVEGVLALVRPDRLQYGSGDRTAALKILLLKQKKQWPALAIGSEDFFSAKPFNIEDKGGQHFASLYWVVSKNYFLCNTSNLGIHLGHGFGYLPADFRQLTDWFGAIELSFKKHFSCSTEYDGRSYNISVRYGNKILALMVGLWDFSYVCGNLVYSFRLADL
jgi:hypothetical protein